MLKNGIHIIADDIDFSVDSSGAIKKENGAHFILVQKGVVTFKKAITSNKGTTTR
jgi:hypothetical protein